MKHIKTLHLHTLCVDYVSLRHTIKEVTSACVGACIACVTVHVLNVDPTVVSRHKVCHHPVTMAPNLAETRRRQGAPCHRGNKSGMLPPPKPAPRNKQNDVYEGSF